MIRLSFTKYAVEQKRNWNNKKCDAAPTMKIKLGVINNKCQKTFGKNHLALEYSSEQGRGKSNKHI